MNTIVRNLFSRKRIVLYDNNSSEKNAKLHTFRHNSYIYIYRYSEIEIYFDNINQ